MFTTFAIEAQGGDNEEWPPSQHGISKSSV